MRLLTNKTEKKKQKTSPTVIDTIRKIISKGKYGQNYIFLLLIINI